MTPSRQSDKMAWGVTFLVFGILILLEKLGVTQALPFADFLRSPGTFFIAAGVIFLMYKKEKTLGLIFTIIGLVINSDLFFGWMQTYRKLTLPLALLAVGLILILSNRKK